MTDTLSITGKGVGITGAAIAAVGAFFKLIPEEERLKALGFICVAGFLITLANRAGATIASPIVVDAEQRGRPHGTGNSASQGVFTLASWRVRQYQGLDEPHQRTRTQNGRGNRIG